jgi:hypothetical protein
MTEVPLWEVSRESNSVFARKMQPRMMVVLVSTLPIWEPKSASPMPPPMLPPRPP